MGYNIQNVPKKNYKSLPNLFLENLTDNSNLNAVSYVRAYILRKKSKLKKYLNKLKKYLNADILKIDWRNIKFQLDKQKKCKIWEKYCFIYGNAQFLLTM